MNKNLCLVGLSGLIVILALLVTKETTALCTADMLNDWPDIPCGSIQLSTEKLREHWQGYYEFKGKEWMEEKRAEMEKAILSGSLEQWRSSISNYNVWVYYKITNNVPEVPPLKQSRFGIQIDEIRCKEGFLVVIKSSNNMPACVKPETKQKLIQRGWGTYQSQYHNSIEVILKDGTKSFVTYDISNGMVKEMRPSIPDRSLVVEIEGYGDGILDITIPRGLVDAKLGDEKSAEDDSFFVLINGSEVAFKEKPPNEVFRSLLIPFSKGASEIEVLGTFLNSGCC